MDKEKKTKDLYLHCTRCGKRVSSVPFVKEPIIRAFVECPECVAKNETNTSV